MKCQEHNHEDKTGRCVVCRRRRQREYQKRMRIAYQEVRKAQDAAS